MKNTIFFLQNSAFPVITVGWNPKPQLPNRWIISLAILQLFFWSIVTISDEIQATQSLAMTNQNERTIGQWVNGFLGILRYMYFKK